MYLTLIPFFNLFRANVGLVDNQDLSSARKAISRDRVEGPQGPLAAGGGVQVERPTDPSREHVPEPM